MLCVAGNGSAPLSMSRCDQDAGVNTSSKQKVLNTVEGVSLSLLSAVMFGSMYVPMKKFDTGMSCSLSSNCHHYY